MTINVKRAYNFNAGPAALPLQVLQQAERDLVDFRNEGLSIMEMSHRSKTYEEVHQEAIDLVRELLNVPDHYDILLMQGGASLQFSMVPMNFLEEGRPGNYVLTGSWSEKALKEAKMLGETRIGASTKDGNFQRIPAVDEVEVDEQDAYVHITSNNTIFGTQWQQFPDTGDVPLIADMSSDILCKPIDVSKFALIYAGAQKNLGPSGVTLVIIRSDLVEKGKENIPTLLQYRTHAKSNSLYHTPPTFGIYMLGLVMKWIKEQGGADQIYEINKQKAALIYDTIDQSGGFYRGHALPDSRSIMNVTFRLADEELEKLFLQKAKEEGFIGLNGHRSVGGCRASIYNAVPMESCHALQQFMQEFQKQHG